MWLSENVITESVVDKTQNKTKQVIHVKLRFYARRDGYLKCMHNPKLCTLYFVDGFETLVRILRLLYFNACDLKVEKFTV